MVDDGGDDVEDEPVNQKHVLLGDPIVGAKAVTYDDSGPGALKPKLLPAPKGMTEAEWAEHCVSHVKYHSGCPFCVSCRRPNSPHKASNSESSRMLPLLVGDYGFVRDSRDQDRLTMYVGNCTLHQRV